MKSTNAATQHPTATITRPWLVNGKREPRSFDVRGTAAEAREEIESARREERFARFEDTNGAAFSITTNGLDVS